MNRLVKDWVFWLFLYLATATSVICAIMGWQMMIVRSQNAQSIEDRAEIRKQQEYHHGELENTRGSLDRIEKHLRLIDNQNQKSIEDRVKLHKTVEEIKEEVKP